MSQTSPSAAPEERRARYAVRRDALTARRRARYASDHEHRAHVRLRRQQWHAEHREFHNLLCVLGKRDLTLDQFHAMQERQDFCCAICGEETALSIDHCHSTNKVRGLLCPACNLGLGAFKDSTAALLGAVAYLS